MEEKIRLDLVCICLSVSSLLSEEELKIDLRSLLYIIVS